MSTSENPGAPAEQPQAEQNAQTAPPVPANQEKPKEEPEKPKEEPHKVFLTTDEWVVEVAKRLEEIRTNPSLTAAHILHVFEVAKIIQLVTPILMEDSSLVECPLPAKIVGDIHGQFGHLQQLLDMIGRVPDQRLLFLGDYVDRGPHSVEVVLYLFCLKIRYPQSIFLLRGNHETALVNKVYGFWAELVQKFGYPGHGLWWDFNAVFNRLPLAGLVGKRILCMHGGLSPELNSLNVIRNIVRPCEPLDSGLLIDLIWADPTNRGEGWFQSIRGMSYVFGKAVVNEACQNLGIDLIVRAHQVVQEGYEFMVGRKLITVFSAPNYCGQFSNAAAVVCVSEDLQISFQQMTVPLPEGSRFRPAPVVAAEVCHVATPTAQTASPAPQTPLAQPAKGA